VLEILEQYVPLGHDVFDFVATDYCLLLEHLDGIVLPCLFVTTQVHLQWKSGGEQGRRRGGEMGTSISSSHIHACIHS